MTPDDVEDDVEAANDRVIETELFGDDHEDDVPTCAPTTSLPSHLSSLKEVTCAPPAAPAPSTTSRPARLSAQALEEMAFEQIMRKKGESKDVQKQKAREEAATVKATRAEENAKNTTAKAEAEVAVPEVAAEVPIRRRLRCKTANPARRTAPHVAPPAYTVTWTDDDKRRTRNVFQCLHYDRYKRMLKAHGFPHDSMGPLLHRVHHDARAVYDEKML